MRQHSSGNYIVEGRKKDLINRGGEKISAEEVENLILSHPAVKNVACIPVPDPDLGERMCACVVLRDGASLTSMELKTFLLGKEIAKYKLPERIEIVADLPLSTFGKVSKKELAEAVCAQDRSGTIKRVLSGPCESSICIAIPTPRNGSPASSLMSTRWPNIGTGPGLRRPRTKSSRISRMQASKRCWWLWTWKPPQARRLARTIFVSAMRHRHPERIIQAWAAVDPFKGEQAICEAQRAIRELGMLGFHFHPIMGHFAVNDRRLYPLFEAINALGVPVMIDVGTTGMGAGMPGGMGAKIRHAHPSAIDELAADFPDLNDRRRASRLALGG